MTPAIEFLIIMTCAAIIAVSFIIPEIIKSNWTKIPHPPVRDGDVEGFNRMSITVAQNLKRPGETDKEAIERLLKRRSAQVRTFSNRPPKGKMPDPHKKEIKKYDN